MCAFVRFVAYGTRHALPHAGPPSRVVISHALTLEQAFTPEEFHLMKLLGKGKLAEVL